MSVFSKTIKSAKLSEFEAPRAGEHPIQLDPHLVDYLPQQRSQENPGLSHEALEELGENIARVGQIQPVIVRPNPDAKGRFIMVAGERRARAVSLRGLKLLAYVREITPEDHLRIQRAENIHREALTNNEIAQALRADKERLGTLDAVAAEWQKSINWVSERLRYLDAVESQPVVQRAIEEGVTGDITTLNELNRLARIDPDAAKTVIDQAAAEPSQNVRQKVREKLKETGQDKKPKPQGQEPAESSTSPVLTPQTVASTRIDESDNNVLMDIIKAAGGTIDVVRDRSLWKVFDSQNSTFQTLDALVAAVWEIDSSTRINLLPST